MGLARKKTQEAPAKARPRVDATAADESPTNGSGVIYPSALRTAFVSLGVALGLALVGLDTTIVATAIPQITAEFEGIYLIGWYSSSFFIALACFQPLWGKIYSVFSIKNTFLLILLFFGVGSLIGGLAPNSSVLILGRAVMGASAAGLASGGYAILGVTVRPRQRPIFTGFVTTVYSIAKVLGPIIGGYFSQHVSWRWCFYVNLPICGLAALVVLLGFKPPVRIQETKLGFMEKLSHTGPLSLVLAFAALFCFTRAVEIAGARKPWASAEVVGLFIGSGLIAAAFLGLQFYQGERAVLVPRLLKQRALSMGMLYGFFHEGAFYLLIYYVPLYFQVILGLSPAEAGVRNLPLLISCGVASAFSGFLVSHLGHVTPLMVLASIGGCIGAGMLSTLTSHSTEAQWIGFQVLAGFSFGAGLPLSIIAGQAKAESQDLSPVTAMLLFSFCVGSSTSLGAGQSVFTNIVMQRLLSLASNVASSNTVEMGISDIRSAYPPELMVGVVAAYTDAVRAVFVIATAYAGAAVLFAAGNSWQRLDLNE